MFNALGNIFTTRPRQAEQTDTRQAIQRHDPDFERPEHEDKDDSKEEFGENGATVSVAALTTFLETFIREHKDVQAQNIEAATAETPPTSENKPEKVPQEISEPTNIATDAAQAASVYAQTAHVGKREDILLETTDQSDGPALDLSAADIRTVHALIQDLKLLQDHNVEFLNIERAATFLDSLVNAVSNAKTLIR